MAKEKSRLQGLRRTIYSMFGMDTPSELMDQKNLMWTAFWIVLGLGVILFIPLVMFTKGYFTYYGDFNAQQISFYRLAHDAVRAGDFGWNWTTDLGVNFIGSYSFYLLGSPFFWLTIPFPSAAVPYLMAPLFILKLAFMSLTSYLFLSRFVKPRFAVLGGMMYALSGFSIYNLFFNHFHEAMIYLPLMLFALERCMSEGKRGLFAFSVFLSAINNYYFFIGQVVFLLIYWGVRLWSGAWKVKKKQIGMLFIEAIVGTMAAGVLLLPSFFSVIQNSRASNLLAGRDLMIYSTNQRFYDILHSFFFPADIPARPNFFPDAGNQWGSMSAWIPLFGCTGAIAYVQHKNHKDWLRRLLIALVIFALIPAFNSLFQLLNWQYYARWFYMLTLMLILATLVMLDQPASSTEINWNRAFGWSGGITAFFAVFIGLVPEDWKAEKIKIGVEAYPDRFWIYVGISAIGLILFYILLDYQKKNPRMFLRLTGLTFAVVSLCYSWYVIGLGKATAQYNSDFVINQAIKGKDTIEFPESQDWYRIDAYNTMDNVGLYWEKPCIQCFHSVVPGSIMDFYESVGVSRSVGSRPEVNHYALRGLLSTKYLYDYLDQVEPKIGHTTFFVDEDGDTKMPGWTFSFETNGWNVYENDNFIPMGFTYDTYMLRSKYDQLADTNKELALLKTLVIEDCYQDDVSPVLEKAFDANFIYGEEEFAEDCAARRTQCASAFDTFSNGFKATITLDKPNFVFFSVPYEPNAWKATVNGEEMEIVQSNVGFMSVLCPAGKCNIEFKYKTPGLTEGLLISFAAIVLFALYMVATGKKLRKKKKASSMKNSEEI